MKTPYSSALVLFGEPTLVFSLPVKQPPGALRGQGGTGGMERLIALRRPDAGGGGYNGKGEKPQAGAAIPSRRVAIWRSQILSRNRGRSAKAFGHAQDRFLIEHCLALLIFLRCFSGSSASTLARVGRRFVDGPCYIGDVGSVGDSDRDAEGFCCSVRVKVVLDLRFAGDERTRAVVAGVDLVVLALVLQTDSWPRS